MKRSSDPAAALSRQSKKPKLSSADIQQVLDYVVSGAPPPPPQIPTPSSSIYLSPVASRLRPRAPRVPTTRAPRKTKPPTKLSLQIATGVPSSSSPPKATSQLSASAVPPVKLLLPLNSSQPRKTTPTSSGATLPPPPTAIQTQPPPAKLPPIVKVPPKKSKTISALSTVPVTSNPTSSLVLPLPPPPKINAPPPAPPPKAKVPPKTTPPPKLPPNLPPSITPEALKILVEISPSQFTPTFLQSSTFKASLLPPTTPEYALISTYISNSQPHPFHISLVHVLNITLGFSPSTNPPPPTFIKNPPKRFCMMLWHGTKPLSVAPILQNGFRCPSTGNQMFGQGIYFADRISKSAKYCTQDKYCTDPKSGDFGYIFLCEVTLGKCYNAKNSNSGYKSAPQITKKDGNVMTFDSLKCTGENIPERQEQKEIDGVIWPMGQTVKNQNFPSYTVLYNEFIVYTPEMVEIRYLAKVKFSCCSVHA